MQLAHEYTQDIEHRFPYVIGVIALFFLLVLARLYYLQVLRGEFYRLFSTENSIKEMTIETPRGVIFDRRGNVLVENRPVFDVVVIPQYVLNPKKTLQSLASLLNLPLHEVETIWTKRLNQPRYQSLTMKQDVTREEVSMIRARHEPWYDERHLFDLRGVEVQMRYERLYPYGFAASHLLGYVREIDQKRLEAYEKKYPGRYVKGDNVGMRGVEETWDLFLRGQDGYEQRVVNAIGREVDYAGIAQQLEHRTALPGANIRLTVDRDLQGLAASSFAGRRGAAVMVKVETVEVLLLYSSPSYDLNTLASREGSRYWQELSFDPSKPLLNRPIQGAYPPASTYKIVTALAARSEEVIKSEETIFCPGAFSFGGRDYHWWHRSGHGAGNLHRSLVQSCDVYYYRVGLRLGVDRIAKFAKLLGYGTPTGIEISDERSGLIPTAAWKEERIGVPWQEGETLSIAVGQGYDLVTPLQSAMMIARVVNGGKIVSPHLLLSVHYPDGREESFESEKNEVKKLDLSPEILKEIRDALVGVVEEVGGTAGRLRSHKASMGGKTGTAQVIRLEAAGSCKGESCRDHAWFVGFSPTEKPEVAIAVIVEHGGFGSSAAAPIAGELMQRYADITHSTQ